MFDILLYLYDTYLLLDRIPDTHQLSRKLTAAGFDSGEISEALDWLSGLEMLGVEADAGLASSRASRIYGADEMRRLDVEGRGFLAFLESAGLLPPHGREWVINQALALPDAEVSAQSMKWIAMLAMWKLKGADDVLWLEDLVRGAEDGDRPICH
ncbi:MAG TPA: DUF494 domain-containing protein [Thiobacillaceae bacterium]|nr:DUF494 domain-containing protein [Thiobacillaceae bacterium]HNU63747.1 DUF494 domain-containing protein [Thiobacillaceae bacterium]